MQIVIVNSQVVQHHKVTMTEAAATFTSKVRESGLQVQHSQTQVLPRFCSASICTDTQQRH